MGSAKTDVRPVPPSVPFKLLTQATLPLVFAVSALQRAPLQEIAERAAPALLFGLAPCGVYPASGIAARAVRSYLGAPTKGPHLFTLTRPGSRLPGREPGGMFSVALSVSEAYGPREHPPPTLAVSEHTALRSSDFPLPRPCQPTSLSLRTRKPALRRGSDHPACPRESNNSVLDGRGQTSSGRLVRRPRFVKRQAEEAFQ